MIFNAYNRFRGAIINTLVDYSILNRREFNYGGRDLREILKILAKTTCGFTLEDIEKLSPFGINNIDTKEIKFENELTYVDSIISFYDRNLNSAHLHQVFVIKNDDECPIIYISMLENIPDMFFKHISRKEVVLDIGNCYTISYKTYINNKTQEVLKEEYIRNYHYEGTNIDNISLLNSLRANSKCLEFAYYNGQFIEKNIDNRIAKYFVENEIDEKVNDIFKILDQESKNNSKSINKKEKSLI